MSAPGGNPALPVLCTLSLLDCRTNTTNCRYGDKNRGYCTKDVADGSGLCKTSGRLLKRDVSKGGDGLVLSTYAMPTEGDRLCCLLPRSFLALTLSGELVEAFHATPCARGVNLIQQVSGRTFSHKLSKPAVSTTRT